jgi:hypothetical protein
LIETEQPLARRWLLLDHDLYVRHLRTQIRRQRLECILRVLLKALWRIEQAGFHVERVDA